MKKESIIKIFRTIVETICLVLTLIFAVFFVMSKIKSKPLMIFNRSAMWVMTESMSPTIPAKTYILVKKISAEEVEVGDIIVFVSTNPQIKGQFNTHRVIEIDGDTFVTKGDNNPIDDGEYSAKAENIYAKYIKINSSVH